MHIHTSNLTFGIECCFGVFTLYSEQFGNFFYILANLSKRNVVLFWEWLGNEVLSLVQDHICTWGSTVSLKLSQNLCSFKWLKFNLRLLNNLIPLGSCTSKTVFPLDQIKLQIVTLNLLIDSIFLILTLSLIHSLMQYRKNEFSDTLVLAGIGLILFCVVERVRYAPSQVALW